MINRLVASIAVLAVPLAATALERTWRSDIQPLVKEQCGACHGSSAPNYEEWNLDRKSFAFRSWRRT